MSTNDLWFLALGYLIGWGQMLYMLHKHGASAADRLKPPGEKQNNKNEHQHAAKPAAD